MLTTYFNPDEFWQGPEVAHRLAFGYGHLTWEWSQKAQLRSAAHPAIFACLYSCLKYLKLDHPILIRHSPRLLQSSLLVVIDTCTYRLADKLFGARVS